MKLVRDSRTLKGKAIASRKIAMMTFNSYDDDGRICSVLLHLQHASEMFLKSVLAQNTAKVFDKDTGKSFGFEKCLRLCQDTHNGRGFAFRGTDRQLAFSHIGLTTDNLEPLIDWYREVLGMTVNHRSAGPPGHVVFCHGGQPKNLTGVAELCCYGLSGSNLARKSLLPTGSNHD